MAPTTRSPTQTLFRVGLAAIGVLLGGLAVSIRSPARRFWPHGDRNWTFWLSWTAWIGYFASLLGVAALDWHESFRPPSLVRAFGTLLTIAGATVSSWAAWRLGFRESSGLEGRLYTAGPYRYSRNPQYVGYIATLAGGSLLSGSKKTIVLSWLGIVWFALAPFAEEPWLEEHYGEAYEEYRKTVPRFIGQPRGPTASENQTEHSNGGNS